jgi:hypothetical protein
MGAWDTLAREREDAVYMAAQALRERDMLRAEREVWVNIAQERNDLRAALADANAAGMALVRDNERLRARLCYVNPDGSHVRGCAQHEAQHPAQWCESSLHSNTQAIAFMIEDECDADD